MYTLSLGVKNYIICCCSLSLHSEGKSPWSTAICDWLDMNLARSLSGIRFPSVGLGTCRLLLARAGVSNSIHCGIGVAVWLICVPRRVLDLFGWTYFGLSGSRCPTNVVPALKAAPPSQIGTALVASAFSLLGEGHFSAMESLCLQWSDEESVRFPSSFMFRRREVNWGSCVRKQILNFLWVLGYDVDILWEYLHVSTISVLALLVLIHFVLHDSGTSSKIAIFYVGTTHQIDSFRAMTFPI